MTLTTVEEPLRRWRSGHATDRDAALIRNWFDRFTPRFVQRWTPRTDCVFGSFEEIQSVALVAFWEAAARWDMERPFHHLLWPRLRGAVLDYFVEIDPMSRPARRDLMAMERVRSRMESDNPPLAMLADGAGLTEDRAEYVYTASKARRMASLFDPVGDGETPGLLIDFIAEEAEEDDTQWLEHHRRFGRSKLGERERAMWDAYYFEDLTLREIGVLHGLTEQRIFQILKQSRTQLQCYYDDLPRAA